MPWTLDHNTATQTLDHWNLRCALEQPDQGWQIQSNSRASNDHLLAIRCSMPVARLAEAYCQQQDLVARYPQAQQPGISLDVRYRVVCAQPERFVLQATYAMQTRDFQSHPTLQISVPSNSKAHELASINRFQTDNFQAAVVMPSADAEQARWIDAGESSVIQFFGDFLERGVIRKCRLRLILSPLSDADRLDCEQELHALSSEPLPLVS